MEVAYVEGMDDKVPWLTSRRFLLSLICFLGFAMLYAQRVNLSMAMVCMVNHTAAHERSHERHADELDVPKFQTVYIGNKTKNISFILFTGSLFGEEHEVCPVHGGGGNSTNLSDQGEYEWSKELQGLLLGAFFWGYLLLQVPGGWLSEHFGAKKVIAAGMFPVAILTIFTPLVAGVSPYFLLIVRVILGVGEAVMYPAAQALFSLWAPPWERSRLIGMAYAGGQFGNAMAFPLSGLLCDYGFAGGWPSIFYVLGSLGFLWCVLWCAVVHDSPRESVRITSIERKYIEHALGMDESKEHKPLSTPWRAIAGSPAVWAIIVAHTCGNWGTYTMLTNLPAYMKEVLHFDIKKNGVFSMLPYLAFWGIINVTGTLADYIIQKKYLTVVWTRKILASIGLILPGVFLIICGYMNCTQPIEAVILLTLAVGMSGLQYGGYFVNHGDIAPPFAGTLFGISNTVATMSGILAPLVVGAVTKDKTREQWLTVFYIAFAIHLFGAIFYLIFAQGTIQEWAKEHMEPPKTKDDKALIDSPKSEKVEMNKHGALLEEEEEHEHASVV